MVKVIFFASIRERMGVENIEVHLEGRVTVKELMKIAAEEIGKEENILLNGGVLFAVNQEMQNARFMVKDGDEVAVLPPLSGGA